MDLFASETGGQVGRNLVDISTIDPRSYASNVGHAVLYLFSRRYIPDQCRRAHLYNFDQAFIDDVKTYAESHLTSNTTVDSHLPRSKAARVAVAPNARGHMVGLNAFSDLWKFVLTVDSNTGGGVFAGAHVPSRSIYSGWIANDQGATRVGAGWALNPNAILTFSHHTVMSATNSPTLSAAGMTSPRMTVTANTDLASSTVLANAEMSGELLRSLEPSVVAGNMVSDSRSNTYVAAPGVSEHGLGIQEQVVGTKVEMEAPIYHLRSIVQAIPDSIAANEPSGPNIYGNDDVFRDTFSFNVNRAAVDITTNGIDTSRPMTIGELQAKFGAALDSQVIVPEFNPSYEIGSAQAPTARNVASAIISTTIPGVIVGLGVSDLSFRYNSTVREQDPNGMPVIGGRMGAYKLLSLGTLYEQSDAARDHAWRSIQYYLDELLWPTIVSQYGHFDVLVHYSLIGSTLVELNLMDHLPDQGLIETNNLMGGLNSPLLGNTAEVTANADQLNMLLTAVCGANDSGFIADRQSLNGYNPLF